MPNTEQENHLTNEYIAFTVKLKSNAIHTAFFLLENYDSEFFRKYIEIYMCQISTFFELFFKFLLTQINPSLIWKKPEDFIQENHDNAKFQSIDARTASVLAKNFHWIDENEFKLIENFRILRNKLSHFSTNENTSVHNICLTKVKNEEFDNIKQLIIKLLENNSQSLNDNAEYVYLKSKSYFQ